MSILIRAFVRLICKCWNFFLYIIKNNPSKQKGSFQNFLEKTEPLLTKELTEKQVVLLQEMY